jgi:hypothetical protein
MKPYWDLLGEMEPISQGWEFAIQALATELNIDDFTYDILFEFAFNNSITLTNMEDNSTITTSSIEELIELLTKS